MTAQAPRIMCAICARQVERIVWRDLFDGATREITVHCHGETDRMTIELASIPTETRKAMERSVGVAFRPAGAPVLPTEPMKRGISALSSTHPKACPPCAVASNRVLQPGESRPDSPIPETARRAAARGRKGARPVQHGTPAAANRETGS